MQNFIDSFFSWGLPAIIVIAGFVLFIVIAMAFRRVVPTNMVHIVQRKSGTTSYGNVVGAKHGLDDADHMAMQDKPVKATGNVYYAWPSWVPVFGVTVLQYPSSIFSVELKSYHAYDTKRLPFQVDATAFFRVVDSETAAGRLENAEVMEEQLLNVVQGAVRRVMAQHTLSHIMESRSELSVAFTSEVQEQIKEWGVTTVKTIEFMDIRDTEGSKVIANIMAMEQSSNDQLSRTTVAENMKTAETAEISARREVELQRQQADQAIGERTAEKEKAVGVAREKSKQEVAGEAAVTAEKTMAVKKVEETKRAEIDKDVAVTKAQAAKETTVIAAEAALQETLKNADGITAEGAARASAESAMLLAPVDAQIKLAKEIGENAGYQTYLIKNEQVKAGKDVGMAQADAIKAAKIQIISNGGAGAAGQIAESVAGIGDLFGLKGGTNLSTMLAALSQTPEGKAVVARVAGGAAAVATAAAALKTEDKKDAAPSAAALLKEEEDEGLGRPPKQHEDDFDDLDGGLPPPIESRHHRRQERRGNRG